MWQPPEHAVPLPPPLLALADGRHLLTWLHDSADRSGSTNQIEKMSYLLHRLSALNSSAVRPALD